MSDTLSTFELFQKFPNEETARTFFEARRWGDRLFVVIAVLAICPSVGTRLAAVG